MDLTSAVRGLIWFLTVAWIGIAVVTIPYGFIVAHDAQKDVDEREASGLNHGRETTARLAATAAQLVTYAFVIFLAIGLYAFSPLVRMSGWWRGLPIPIGLVVAEALLSYMLIHTQRTRKRVLERDIVTETARLTAAAIVSKDMQGNTAAAHDLADALRENTRANERMTHEMGNGPLAASLASTVALDRLSVAMDTSTALHTTEVEANTVGLEASTLAAEDLKVSTDELKTATDTNTATLEIKTRVDLLRNGDGGADDL